MRKNEKERRDFKNALNSSIFIWLLWITSKQKKIIGLLSTGVSDEEHRRSLFHALIYSMPQTNRNLLEFMLKFINNISNENEQNLTYLLFCFGLAFTKRYLFSPT
jgi:hypothetical protein